MDQLFPFSYRPSPHAGVLEVVVKIGLTALLNVPLLAAYIATIVLVVDALR
jgi:hypothetical protein